MDSYGDSFACFYDRYFGGYSEHSAPYLLHYASTLSPNGHLPRILDLGCGTGHLARRFLESGYEVTGLDLSPAMLALAKTKCLPFIYEGKASFVKADLTCFEKLGPFDLALSTYNVFNHLTDAQLAKAFRNLGRCLVPAGTILFDYQTRLGLKEWVAQERIPLAQGTLETDGRFDKSTGSAWMRLKGSVDDETFDETIYNHSISIKKLRSLLEKEGWQSIRFSRLDLLDENIPNPEKQKRVVVLAQWKSETAVRMKGRNKEN
jgi:SAM-dependent methyltransferase